MGNLFWPCCVCAERLVGLRTVPIALDRAMSTNLCSMTLHHQLSKVIVLTKEILKITRNTTVTVMIILISDFLNFAPPFNRHRPVSLPVVNEQSHVLCFLFNSIIGNPFVPPSTAYLKIPSLFFSSFDIFTCPWSGGRIRGSLSFQRSR